MYLGLDLGEVTMGVSISNSGIISQALETFRFQKDDYETCYQHLIGLIKENMTKVVVIGLPKHMNNDIGIRANISIDFKNRLNQDLPDLEVILLDERLTTQQVKRNLSSISKSNNKISNNKAHKKGQINKKFKEKKDELAACIILQAYLDRR